MSVILVVAILWVASMLIRLWLLDRLHSVLIRWASDGANKDIEAGRYLQWQWRYSEIDKFQKWAMVTCLIPFLPLRRTVTKHMDFRGENPFKEATKMDNNPNIVKDKGGDSMDLVFKINNEDYVSSVFGVDYPGKKATIMVVLYRRPRDFERGTWKTAMLHIMDGEGCGPTWHRGWGKNGRDGAATTEDEEREDISGGMSKGAMEVWEKTGDAGVSFRFDVGGSLDSGSGEIAKLKESEWWKFIPSEVQGNFMSVDEFKIFQAEQTKEAMKENPLAKLLEEMLGGSLGDPGGSSATQGPFLLGGKKDDPNEIN